MDIEVNKNILSPKFQELLTKEPKRHNWYWGGGSSGKSYSVAVVFVLAALEGHACLVARATQASIRKSTWNDIRQTIDMMGVGEYFDINKTEMVIQCTISPGSFSFVGCDKEDRVKSIKPPKQPAFSRLWLEECNDIPIGFFSQLNIRLRGKPIGGFNKAAYYTWNPVFETHFLNTKFMMPLGFTDDDSGYEDKDNRVSRSTYKDNPFLTTDDVEYLENLEVVSPYHYRVYALGKWGSLGERCIESSVTIEKLDYDVVSMFPAYMGLDAGMTHPTVIVMCRVDKVNRIVYIVGQYSKSKMGHEEIAKKIKNMQIINNAAPVVYADPEDQRLIKLIKGEGVPIKNAKKPPGSVLNGIQAMNTYSFVVDESLKEMYNSLIGYSWLMDARTSEPIDKPGHAFSDEVDALRYSLEPILSGSVRVTGGRQK